MNPNELKPFWEAYKDHAGQQCHWNEAQLAELMQQHTRSYPWLLNLCMTFLLISTTGC